MENVEGLLLLIPLFAVFIRNVYQTHPVSGGRFGVSEDFRQHVLAGVTVKVIIQMVAGNFKIKTIPDRC